MQEVGTVPPFEPGVLKWLYAFIGGAFLWAMRILYKKHDREVEAIQQSVKDLETQTNSALAGKAGSHDTESKINRIETTAEIHRQEYRQDLIALHTRIENMGSELRSSIESNGKEAAARQAETLQAILKLKTT